MAEHVRPGGFFDSPEQAATAVTHGVTELSLEPTEHEGQGAGGAAATASPVTCDCLAPYDNLAEPMTPVEFDSIVSLIWHDLDSDRSRVGDLLADALGFIGGIAVDIHTDPHDADRATAVLRAMEQRALFGPYRDQEDHR